MREKIYFNLVDTNDAKIILTIIDKLKIPGQSEQEFICLKDLLKFKEQTK